MKSLVLITMVLILTGCAAFEAPPPEPWETSDTQMIIIGCERANQEASSNEEQPVC